MLPPGFEPSTVRLSGELLSVRPLGHWMNMRAHLAGLTSQIGDQSRDLDSRVDTGSQTFSRRTRSGDSVALVARLRAQYDRAHHGCTLNLQYMPPVTYCRESTSCARILPTRRSPPSAPKLWRGPARMLACADTGPPTALSHLSHSFQASGHLCTMRGAGAVGWFLLQAHPTWPPSASTAVLLRAWSHH